MTQGSRGRLSSVAITLANLYRIYSQNDKMDKPVQKIILDSIAKRWAKTDQDSFILAVFLNPYIRHSLFQPTSGFATQAGIQNLVERMWNRFFPIEAGADLFKATTAYYKRTGIFSDDEMMLKTHKKNLMPVSLLYICLIPIDTL
jgi:hypothetical protein